MFLEIIITLTGGLLLFIVSLVAGRIILNQYARLRFKKLSNGLPMCEGENLLSNHTNVVMFGSNSCKKLQAWHKEKGKTIGFLTGHNFCASTIDLDLIKAFIHDDPEPHLNRLKFGAPASEFEDSILFMPRDEWRQARRVLAPALTANKFKAPNVMQEIQESIGKVIGLIELKLGKNSSRLIEIDDLVQRYAADLVAKCFYKQDNMVTFEDKVDRWVRLIDKSLNQIQTHPILRLSMMFPFLKRAIDWISWNYTRQGAGRRALYNFVKIQTDLAATARKELGELKSVSRETGAKLDPTNFVLRDGTRFRRNMIDHVIDSYLDGKLTKHQYEATTCFLMAAATRTASDTIGFTIYLLAIHQEVQDKLRRSIISDGTESEYLDWVLKESMRVYPPAPLGCSRLIGRDLEVEGGYVLPRGTYVTTCSYVIHRLKEYWGEDADDFKPERWQDTRNHHPLQYIPFGAGPRGCPGRMFAMHEMKMFFTALLTRYKFEAKPRKDAFDFEAPFFIFVVPRSETEVTISRLDASLQLN